MKNTNILSSKVLRSPSIYLTTTLILFLGCVQPTLAQVFPSPGMLDLTFGRAGMVVTPVESGIGHRLRDVLFQQDGKIIVVGSYYQNISPNYQNRFLLARYNSNGTLDEGFGNLGISAVWFGAEAHARSAAFQPDGKILVAGDIDGNFVVARYHSYGSLDTSFGSDGLAHTDFANFEEKSLDIVGKVFVQPSGKIITVGNAMYSPFSSTPYDDDHVASIAITRHNSDGSVDYSYGNSGKLITELPLRSYATSHVLSNSDGSFFVHCYGSGPKKASDPYGEQEYDWFVAKYDVNGNIDSSFGEKGFLRGPNSPFYPPRYNVLKVLPNNQLLVSSDTNKLVRFNSNGTIDKELLSLGEFTVGGQRFWPGGFLIQMDGSIIIPGSLPDHPGDFDRGLVRMFQDGQIDRSFGNDGLTIGLFNDVEQKFWLQPDGKILNAQVNLPAIIIARYHGTQSPAGFQNSKQ